MRSSRTFMLVIGAAALSACSILPSGAPDDASKKDFCDAYAASKGLYERAPGAPVARWETVRTSMLKIHDIGTPTGSDGDARNVVLRLSDVVKNAKDEAAARQQVDAYFDQHAGAKATMTEFYGAFCK